MPLEEEIQNKVLDYCRRDLPQSFDWYLEEFNFVRDPELQHELAKEFYSARYIYKLMEALNVSDIELHAHSKFQIIQYASIYEAIISYLLKEYLKDEDQVKKLNYHKAYKPVAALSSLTEILYDEEKAYICLHKDERTPQSSIKFGDKVDVIVDLGILKESYGEEIKEFYKTRNSIHIETAVKLNTEYHIELTKTAYRRLRPFINSVKEYLKVEV